MRIRIIPAAELDLLEAQAWYNLQRSGLGGEFRVAAAQASGGSLGTPKARRSVSGIFTA